MTDDLNQGMNDTDAVAAANAVKTMPVMFHAQFVRDISFENPQPATIYETKGSRPVMDVGFSIECLPVPSQQFKSMYEVQVGVKIQARRDDSIAFVTEVLYSVLASLDGVSEEQHHPLLYIEVPRYAFPYVRQIISDLTAQAGMLPLLLSPVDFRALYMQRFGEEIKKSRAAAGAA